MSKILGMCIFAGEAHIPLSLRGDSGELSFNSRCRLWFPLFLGGKNFIGYFIFRSDNELEGTVLEEVDNV